MIKDSIVMAIAAAGLLLAGHRAVRAQDARPVHPPLKPGQSAGVRVAQQAHTGLALIGTGAIVAIVIVAATSSSGGGNNGQLSLQSAPATTAP